MFKYYLFLLLFPFCTFVSGQEMRWGKLSPEEIALEEVPFEKGAEAVILKETGYITINAKGYELLQYGRIKILSDSGFDQAAQKWTYHASDKYDKVILEDAQTLNVVEGKVVITPLNKKDIIISKDEDEVEIAFAFPNVRVGSVIEFKVKIFRPGFIYTTPWRFQNEIPTLSSNFYLDLKEDGAYKVILRGKMLVAKYGNKNRNKSWELSNIPSDKIFKNVYNAEDHRERIMLQYSNSRGYYGGYLSENSWSGFKKLIKEDIKESKKYVDFTEIANKIETGSTKLETLKNCLHYLRENFEWNKYTAVQSFNLASKFFVQKRGNAADFNIVLAEILKIKNIKSELAINSLRSNGRIIVSFPAFAKMQTLVNIVEVENAEQILVDAASSTPEKIRFPNLEFYNQMVLPLDEKGDRFTLVVPPVSEIVSRQVLPMTGENSTLKINNKSRGYFNSDSFNNKALNVFSGTKISEILNEEKDEWKTSSQTIEFEKPSNGVTVIENPFSKIIRQLKVEKDRDYPVELDFPYLATVQLKVKTGENQQIIFENFNKTLNQREGNLQYSQTIENVNGEEIVTWSLLLKQVIFQNKEIEEYNQFVEQLEEAVSKAIVIKNR